MLKTHIFNYFIYLYKECIYTHTKLNIFKYIIYISIVLVNDVYACTNKKTNIAHFEITSHKKVSLEKNEKTNERK